MADVSIMVVPQDGGSPRAMVDSDTVMNLNAGAGMDTQITAELNYGTAGQMAAAGLAAANAAGTVAKAAHIDHAHAANFGVANDMAAAGVAAANAAGDSGKPADAKHVHAMPYSAVKAALGAANSSLAMNSQKITGVLAGANPGEVAIYEQLADGALRGDLANVANAKGASLVAVEDPTGLIAAADQEATNLEVGSFNVSIGLTKVEAANGKDILADAKVPAGKKVYVSGFALAVGGGTLWSGDFTKLTIQDNNGTAVLISEIAKAALGANAVVRGSDATNVTPKIGFVTGGTAAKGLKIISDAAIAAGSDITLRVWFKIGA